MQTTPSGGFRSVRPRLQADHSCCIGDLRCRGQRVRHSFRRQGAELRGTRNSLAAALRVPLTEDLDVQEIGGNVSWIAPIVEDGAILPIL